MNNPMILANVKEDFYLNFIKDDRYLWLLDGLKTNLIITVFAVIVSSSSISSSFANGLSINFTNVSVV